MTQIFVENQRLDLTKDLSAEFTYSIDDIKDFSSRNTGYSKTIVIPGNATNNKLFGHIFEFGSANPHDPAQRNISYNFNAAKSAACIVFIDQVQVFKGILRLMEIVLDSGTIEYECAVLGELGGFVDALGNDRLEDLDFSSYDHVWSVSNIVDSWDASGAYYYPLIDYGQVSTNKKDFDISAFRPALYVREYMDKIITGSGYTYEAPFFDSAFFKRLIVPHNQKALTKVTSEFNKAFLTTPVEILSSRLISFDTITGSGLTVSGTNSTFTYTGTKSINLKMDYEFFGDSTSGIFRIARNGSTVYQQNFEGGIGFVDTFELLVNTNDAITFRFSNNAPGRDDPPVTVTDGQVSFYSDSFVPTVVSVDDALFMADVIPKGIFQRDFFSSIVKMFNLYVLEDSQKPKHLIIKPYIDYYQTGVVLLDVNDFGDSLLVNDTDRLLLEDGAFSYLDWTYKVDRSKAMKLKPMSELNGRYFEFKYKSDIDWYNEQYQKKFSEGYGDRIEDTGYEFGKDKQTCEVIFAATPLVGYLGEDKVVSTVFKLSNAVEDRTEHTIRILQAKKITGVSSWALKNGSSTLTSLTSYGYAGHLDDPTTPNADLNFGAPKELYFDVSSYPSANVFNGFWSDYIAEITDKDSKLLTCEVYLTAPDIYSLDFARLIYIDGALWRLNTVEDYDGENPCKCTFLRVLNTTYA